MIQSITMVDLASIQLVAEPEEEMTLCWWEGAWYPTLPAPEVQAPFEEEEVYDKVWLNLERGEAEHPTPFQQRGFIYMYRHTWRLSAMWAAAPLPISYCLPTRF